MIGFRRNAASEIVQRGYFAFGSSSSPFASLRGCHPVPCHISPQNSTDSPNTYTYPFWFALFVNKWWRRGDGIVQIRKSYLTVCVGNPGKGAVIDVPIGRHPTHRQRMVAVPTIQPNVRARRAVSIVSTEAFDGKLGVAEVAIETGRTHQIRVHMQASNEVGLLKVLCVVYDVFQDEVLSS